jgi:hypothetical protein
MNTELGAGLDFRPDVRLDQREFIVDAKFLMRTKAAVPG